MLPMSLDCPFSIRLRLFTEEIAYPFFQNTGNRFEWKKLINFICISKSTSFTLVPQCATRRKDTNSTFENLFKNIQCAKYQVKSWHTR